MFVTRPPRRATSGATAHRARRCRGGGSAAGPGSSRRVPSRSWSRRSRSARSPGSSDLAVALAPSGRCSCSRSHRRSSRTAPLDPRGRSRLRSSQIDECDRSIGVPMSSVAIPAGILPDGTLRAIVADEIPGNADRPLVSLLLVDGAEGRSQVLVVEPEIRCEEAPESWRYINVLVVRKPFEAGIRGGVASSAIERGAS
jgi:hypothetical protein